MNRTEHDDVAIRAGGVARLGRLLLPLVALMLILSACGGDDEVVAGSGADTEAPADAPDGVDDGDDGEDGRDEAAGPADEPADDESDNEPDNESDNEPKDESDDGMATDGDIVRTESRPEMISPQKAVIQSVETIDDSTLGVRFQNGAEPCAAANVTVTETADSVTVLLETGLDPNAAAMSCIAQVFDYEIRVGLDAPIGDREIIVDSL